MSRSLKVSSKHLETVKLALFRNSFPSQRALALDLGLALSTVSRFCTGKPVDYGTFIVKPASLIRIKDAGLMGKSSLMIKVLY